MKAVPSPRGSSEAPVTLRTALGALISRLGLDTLPGWSLWLWLTLSGFFLVAMPHFCDDLCYTRDLEEFYVRHNINAPEDGVNLFETGLPVTDIWQAICRHYEALNGRLGNYLAYPMLLLPKWMASGLSALVWAFAVWGIFRCGRIDWRRSPAVWMLIFTASWFIPWRDRMGGVDYQLNYIWPTAISVWLLYCLSRPMPTRRGVLPCLMALLFGLVAGAWHEGFGVPLIAALAVMAIWGGWPRLRTLCALAGVVAGCAYLRLSPGFTGRIGITPVGFQFSRYWDPFFVLYDRLPVISGLLVWGITYLLSKRSREALAGRRMVSVAVAVSALASWVLGEWLRGHGRVMWWADFCGVYLWTVTVAAWLKISGSSWKSTVLKGMLGLLAVVGMSRMAVADWYALRFNKVATEAFALWRTDGDPEYFCDFPWPNQIPWIAWGLPDDTFLTDLLLYWHPGGKWQVESSVSELVYADAPTIVPVELKMASPSLGVPIDGDPDQRIEAGHVFRPAADIHFYYWVMDYDFGKGYGHPCYTWVIPFRSQADGKWYHWLVPRASDYVLRCKRIHGIRFMREVPYS